LELRKAGVLESFSAVEREVTIAWRFEERQ